VAGGGVGRPLGAGSGERIFLNFQVKNAAFYALLLRITTCGQKPGDLIDPPGG